MLLRPIRQSPHRDRTCASCVWVMFSETRCKDAFSWYLFLILHFSNYSWVFGRLDSPGLSGSGSSLCPGPNGSDRLILVSHCNRLVAVGDHSLPPSPFGPARCGDR